ncbi:MAG: 2-C-methyl-D-erythritol 4-phosphate cytidylyltransferase [Oceanospirillaceae bacterium]|nr:2-C-methyl-D-erythritol 4-phosphate cytidylyltransferase [Oceanospirillaceae bacterium]
MNNTLYMVVPAAGVGARMAASCPKQYLPLGEKSIIEHTLARLLAFGRTEAVVVALGEFDEYWPDTEFANHPMVKTVIGGSERVHSVFNALQYLLAQGAAPDSWVMVHDAARPCISQTDLENLWAKRDPQGALLGSQVRDTMKRTDANGVVLHTVPRELLWHALTPQMAPLKVLHDAISHCLAQGMLITDDASALEGIGLQPRMVAGNPGNIKITRPQDLALAELYLQQENMQ